MSDFEDNYIFISYCHSDPVFHREALAFFKKYKYNVVDDHEINYGDQWDIVVRKFINNQLCRGVVCLVSEESLKSRNVLHELDLSCKYKKKVLTITIDDDPIEKLIEKLTGEHEIEVAKEIHETLGEEALYISKNNLESDFPRIEKTFSKWGIKPYEDNLSEQVDIEKYSTAIDGEKERLEFQQRSYSNVDTEILDDLMEKWDRSDLVVVDFGCSNGSQTYSRFDKYKNIKTIIGIDYYQPDIDEANSKNYGDKYRFFTADLDSESFVDDFKKILKACNTEKIDFAFSAMTLHHLKGPEAFLSNIFDFFAPGGKIYIRSPDDGGKCCYPESELLEEIIRRNQNLVNNASDRYFARKMYGMLFNTGYSNIHYHYNVYDTCEQSRNEKENIFNIAFGFRLNRLKKLEEKNKDRPNVMEEIKWQKEAINKMAKLFARRDFWFQSITYVAIAEVE